MKKYGRLLCGHAKLMEAAIKGRLQPYAGSEKPRNGDLRLPFTDTDVLVL
jgi:hypothetical protein